MELKEEVDTANRQDEWMIEQGMAGHKLPILDQSGRDTIHLYPPKADEIFKDEETIASVGNGKKLFKRERPGWKGYIYIYPLFPNTSCTDNPLHIGTSNGRIIQRKKQKHGKFYPLRVSQVVQILCLVQFLRPIL